MKRRPSNPTDAAELRRRAEARLSEKQQNQGLPAGDQRTAHDTQRLVQELQIHQVELEIQNEQLGQARADTQEALECYTDLYEFAPSAYLTLSRERKQAEEEIRRLAAALTGYTAEEAIGRTPRLLKSGKHELAFYKNLWTTLLAGGTWRGSFTNRRKDGSFYHDEHTITPVRSKDGGLPIS